MGVAGEEVETAKGDTLTETHIDWKRGVGGEEVRSVRDESRQIRGEIRELEKDRSLGLLNSAVPSGLGGQGWGSCGLFPNLTQVFDRKTSHKGC